MSACSYFRQGDRAHLVTDAASYRNDGTIVELASKVVRVPAIGAAYSIRGALGGYRDWIDGFVAGARSFEDLLSKAERAVGWIHRNAARNQSADSIPDLAHFELTMAGYSTDREQCEGWTISTFPAGGPGDLPGYAPFALLELPVFIARPGVASLASVLGANITTIEQLDALDPVLVAADLLNAQREVVATERGLRGVRCVGGFGELTTVTAEGVSTIEVIRWDDRVGDKIGGGAVNCVSGSPQS